VFICDFVDQHLATHVREINSLYPECEVHARQFDASEETAVKGIVQEALDKYGRLDVFFANAGIAGTPVLFSDIEADSFMKTMKVNLLRFV
jgi:NAD(P)-dependent dehydrogenase (short-subunit alcohol dehydrogenase family)